MPRPRNTRTATQAKQPTPPRDDAITEASDDLVAQGGPSLLDRVLGQSLARVSQRVSTDELVVVARGNMARRVIRLLARADDESDGV